MLVKILASEAMVDIEVWVDTGLKNKNFKGRKIRSRKDRTFK
jgi:hypothetical protein